MIITATNNWMDVNTWTDIGKAILYCAKMDELGIAYHIEFW